MFDIFIESDELGDELEIVGASGSSLGCEGLYLNLSPLHRLSRLIVESESISVSDLRISSQVYP
jgi:hypothetical protein